MQNVVDWIWGLAIVIILGWGLFRWRDRHVHVIETSAKCPACGHRNGSIQFFTTELVQPQDPKLQPHVKNIARVTHVCNVCKAQWSQAPMQPKIWEVSKS